jgi:hypothetical protein
MTKAAFEKIAEGLTDSDIIEAVARALCAVNGMDPDTPIDVGADFRGQPQWRLYDVEARAAIEAYESAITTPSLPAP